MISNAGASAGASAGAGAERAAPSECPVCRGSGVPHGMTDGGASWHCPSCGESAAWPAWLQIGHAALSGTLMLTFWWVAWL